METPEQRLEQAIRTHGVDDGLAFLMVELEETLGEALTQLRYTLFTEALSDAVRSQIDATTYLLREGIAYTRLLQTIRDYLEE